MRLDTNLHLGHRLLVALNLSSDSATGCIFDMPYNADLFGFLNSTSSEEDALHLQQGQSVCERPACLRAGMHMGTVKH